MLTIRLVLQSILSRRLTSFLTLASVMLSVALFVGVERVRQGARDSFAGTISQTDLIVGARGGTIQLLLYAVFRLGSATGNISYTTYLKLRDSPDVAWTIPYSLGDSYRGFRVVGTTTDFYEHYRYRRDRRVEFASGQVPKELFDAVLGADVADRIGYGVGDNLVLAHGVADIVIEKHSDKPFKVVGVLEKTGTPIDRSVYITLEGMEAMHVDWGDGAPPVSGAEVSAQDLRLAPPPIKAITAFLLGAKSRLDTLRLQRTINDFQDEPLTAIIPGVALSELWDGISYAEDGLRVVSGFVVVVGLLGMLISIYNSLNERRREMAILRSVGAGPPLIFSLLISESLVLTVVGSTMGVLCMYAALFVLQPFIENHFGLLIPIKPLSEMEWLYLGTILLLGLTLGVVPAVRAYRNTLHDGLTMRL